MRHWDKPARRTLQKSEANRFPGNGLRDANSIAAFVVPLVLLAACDGPAPIGAETIEAESMAAEITELACGQDGQLTVELYGAIRTSIDWRAEVLSCTGMPRPDGDGARVRWSGPISTSGVARTLAFILGLPGLEPGQSGTELPTIVTLIEVGTGRF